MARKRALVTKDIGPGIPLNPAQPVLTPRPQNQPVGVGYGPTTIERNLLAALRKLGLEAVPQYPFGVFAVDAFVPSLNLALEADGCFYHGCRECGFHEDHPYAEAKRVWRDRKLQTEYRVAAVIHIFGHDLANDWIALKSVSAALAPYLDSGSQPQNAL